MIGHYGGDETHALSAWTSTSRILTKKKRGRIPRLLKMLAENEHGTPFEKSMLHFLVRTDIATHIHILKHRIGTSTNAESARYKELKEDTYLTPDDWDEDELAALEETANHCFKAYHEALHRMTEMGIPLKRAKESARFHLPYATQLTADVSFNWRSFFHFISLRYSQHAQREVRDVAREMLHCVVNLPGEPFGATMRSFGLIDDQGNIRPPFDSEELEEQPKGLWARFYNWMSERWIRMIAHEVAKS